MSNSSGWAQIPPEHPPTIPACYQVPSLTPVLTIPKRRAKVQTGTQPAASDNMSGARRIHAVPTTKGVRPGHLKMHRAWTPMLFGVR